MVKRWLRFAIQNHIENPFGNPLSDADMFFIFTVIGVLIISPFAGLFGLPMISGNNDTDNQIHFIIAFFSISFCIMLMYFGIITLMLKITKKNIRLIPYGQYISDYKYTKLMFLTCRKIDEYGTLKLNTIGWLNGDSLFKPLLISKPKISGNKGKHDDVKKQTSQFKQIKKNWGQFSIIAFFNKIKVAFLRDATYCDEENSLAIAVLSFWNDTTNGVSQHIVAGDICPRKVTTNQDPENDARDDNVNKGTSRIKDKSFPNGPEFGHNSVCLSTPSTARKQIKSKNGTVNFTISNMPASTDYDFVSLIAKQNAGKVMTCLMCKQKNVCYNRNSNRQNYQEVNGVIKDTHFSIPFKILIALTATFWLPIYLTGNRRNEVRILSPAEYALYKEYDENSPYALQKKILWLFIGFLHSLAVYPLVFFIMRKYF
nr:hypothetical protein [Desulfotruncus alcoholivorax]